MINVSLNSALACTPFFGPMYSLFSLNEDLKWQQPTKFIKEIEFLYAKFQFVSMSLWERESLYLDTDRFHLRLEEPLSIDPKCINIFNDINKKIKSFADNIFTVWSGRVYPPIGNVVVFDEDEKDHKGAAERDRHFYSNPSSAGIWTYLKPLSQKISDLSAKIDTELTDYSTQLEARNTYSVCGIVGAVLSVALSVAAFALGIFSGNPIFMFIGYCSIAYYVLIPIGLIVSMQKTNEVLAHMKTLQQTDMVAELTDIKNTIDEMAQEPILIKNFNRFSGSFEPIFDSNFGGNIDKSI